MDEVEDPRTPSPPPPIDKIALTLLLIQHFSSTWSSRSADFAFSLFFITLFQTTLLPSSLYGFSTTVIAIIWASSMGKIVDKWPHLDSVRLFITVQKLSATIAYVGFLTLFLIFPPNGMSPNIGIWSIFVMICVAGAALKLSSIGINVAIEREWVMLIAKDSQLTHINAYVRRIDLISKLIASLFVASLTSIRGPVFAIIFLASIGIVLCVFELGWIQVVYDRSIAVQMDDVRKRNTTSLMPYVSNKNFKSWSREQIRLWRSFRIEPAFYTSVAISLLFITVLSFDGAMIGYLVWRGFSYPIIGTMRAANVITGLLGTFLGPKLIYKVGLVKAGNWSIWLETFILIPVVISFFSHPAINGDTSPIYTAVLLFAFTALSRAPLWMFDLTQLQIVQESFSSDNRASLMSLQFSMQNMGNLLHYSITLVFQDPAEFRWPALISFLCVATGAVVYSFGYARRKREYLMDYSRLPLLQNA